MTIGQDLTIADEHQIWNHIVANQQKILADRQGSRISERYVQFDSDKNSYLSKEKSNSRKIDRKNEKQIVRSIIESD